MKYRNQDEGGDLFAFIEHQKKAKASQRSTGVGRLAEIIEWEGFRSDLEDILGYVTRDDSKGGRPPFDPVFMFKVLVLQKFPLGCIVAASRRCHSGRKHRVGFPRSIRA